MTSKVRQEEVTAEQERPGYSSQCCDQAAPLTHWETAVGNTELDVATLPCYPLYT